MLEIGKFITFRSAHPDLLKFKDWIVFYIDRDFPLNDMKILFEQGWIEARESTEREKRLCYLQLEETIHNRGIFVNELDKFENYITKTDYESTEEF
jgi:hypothetical protein